MSFGCETKETYQTGTLEVQIQAPIVLPIAKLLDL